MSRLVHKIFFKAGVILTLPVPVDPGFTFDSLEVTFDDDNGEHTFDYNG
jgi:hypothetical protein